MALNLRAQGIHNPQLDASLFMDIVFCLDSSGSVETAEFELARKSVVDVVKTLDFSCTRVAVMQFHSSAHMVTEGFVKDKFALIRSVSSFHRLSGGTSFAKAFGKVRELWVGRNSSQKNRRFVVVLQTDGHSQDDCSTQVTELKAKACHIICVGVGSGVNEKQLQTIGHVYVPVKGYVELPRMMTKTFTALSANYKKQ